MQIVWLGINNEVVWLKERTLPSEYTVITNTQIRREKKISKGKLYTQNDMQKYNAIVFCNVSKQYDETKIWGTNIVEVHTKSYAISTVYTSNNDDNICLQKKIYDEIFEKKGRTENLMHSNMNITSDIFNPGPGLVRETGAGLVRETGGYFCERDSRKLWTVLNRNRIIALTTERYSLFSPGAHQARRGVQDGLL